MKRRAFVKGVLALSGAAALPAGVAMCPALAWAQQPALPARRIGYLSNFSAVSGRATTDCFVGGLRDLGWVEGKNLQIEYRWADGRADRFHEFVEEMVRLRPDVIVVNGTPGAQVVHRTAGAIPAVFISVSDPVASGIVESLARPGGNITGVSNFLPATTAKLLELLKIISPNISTVGVLHNPSNPGKLLELQVLQRAARAADVAIVPLEVRGASDFERAFSNSEQARCDALITLQEGVTLANRSRIVEFATRLRLPAIFQIREYVEAGGLMSYGLNFCQHFRHAASYVDKILKGARPGDLPVELPTTFELLINLKSARAMGLDVPQSLLLRADEVIE